MSTSINSNTTQASQAFARLLTIMDELREKCPWDQQQSMESLRYLTIEETYELSEAVISADTDEIKKELGDLLLHIVFYSRIASETQDFTIAEVIHSLCEKLIYRHPHIYGQQKVADSKAVQENWEKLKLKEEKRKSVLEGVPSSLPSLLKAIRVNEKARRVGFDWKDKETVWNEVQETMTKLRRALSDNTSDLAQQNVTQELVGRLLFTFINYASLIEINPEDALEKANQTFIKILQKVEQQLAAQGKNITQLSQQELREYWEQQADV